MAPTLQPGRIVIAIRRRELRKGQVVVIKHQGLEKVKRIHAAHGAAIEVRGDNASNSTDSRNFGPVDRDQVLGVIVWPRV